MKKIYKVILIVILVLFLFPKPQRPISKCCSYSICFGIPFEPTIFEKDFIVVVE